MRFDEHALAQPKIFATRTLTKVIEDALRAAPAQSRLRPGRAKIALSSFGGSGLRPGIDSDDSASLPEAMESSDAAA
jgi:hypothetical protein